MRFLIDTNVVIRLIQGGQPQQIPASSALRHLETTGHEICVVPQVFYEFWAVATRPAEMNGLGLDAAEAGRVLGHMQSLFTLLRDERTIFDYWEALVTTHAIQGKASHDARLVAAMRRHSLSHLLTFNPSDFERFSQIVVVTPAMALTL